MKPATAKAVAAGSGSKLMMLCNSSKRIGIRFLRLSGPRINRRVAGGVFSLEIVLLLRQREDSADDALDVLQSVAAQFAPQRSRSASLGRDTCEYPSARRFAQSGFR